jgi:hypothetical protein
MTRKEAKTRLRFIAEWWSPEVLLVGDPGCVLQVALEVPAEASIYVSMPDDMSYKEISRIGWAWDSNNREAALRAIDALPE